MNQTQATHRTSVTRTIAAPRQRVFEAWIKPELRKKWWSAKAGMFCDLADIDAQPGGKYRINMKETVGGDIREYVCVGEFLEVDEPSKLVFTWSWETPIESSPGTEAVDTLVTVEFREVNGGTEVRLTHERFATEVLPKEHEQGWTGCLESLAKVLED